MRLIDADNLQIVSIDDPTEWDKDNKFFYVPKRYVDDAPTIDAEPVRHGRWQVNEMFDYKDMTCLSCGWIFEYHNGLEEEMNYCPHCGAKMDEEREIAEMESEE